MQSQIQRFNTGGLFRIGIVIFLLALVASGIQRWYGEPTAAMQPATVTAQEPAAAAVDMALKPEAPTASTLDALLSEAAALGDAMPAVGSVTEAAIESRWGAQTYTNGAATCEYSILDSLGLSNCQASVERFMEACLRFYSADHCTSRMQAGVEQAPTGYQQASQPQAVALYPNRPLNYVPEHWGPGIRAALQYPAGLQAQQWANEHLYPAR